MAKRVLIIDDDQDILDLYHLILEPEGYEVFPLAQVDTALKEIHQFHPDLIIVDYMLQTRDEGWKLLQSLQQCPETSALPLVLCTAAVEEIRKREGYFQETGVSIVFKPFDVDTLLQVVNELLQATVQEPLSA